MRSAAFAVRLSSEKSARAGAKSQTKIENTRRKSQARCLINFRTLQPPYRARNRLNLYHTFARANSRKSLQLLLDGFDRLARQGVIRFDRERLLKFLQRL